VDSRQLLTVPWAGLLRVVLGETAVVTYAEGTHAERLAVPAAAMRPGTWWYETDRTVLYQARLYKSPAKPPDAPPEPRWFYVMGTMTGTLSPDERPADLGPSDLLTPPTTAHPSVDTGFQFEATDTAQLWLWDGTQWVDATPYPSAIYGTHAQRLAQPVARVADGALWAETDRGNVLYQLHAGLWWYVAGTMFGTLSPDQRPADLGVRDVGFDFRTSIAPQREFMWSGTAWQEVLQRLTPWTEAIDGAGFPLSNCGAVTTTAKGSRFGSAAGAASTTPLSQTDANILLYANATQNWSGMGTDGGGNFWVRVGLSGTPVAALIINTAGAPYLPYLPSAYPGAGTKGLYYDAADGNRVKFAP
jgi:hypothetical protein